MVISCPDIAFPYLAICQIIMSLSSPPVARYLPPQDQRTQLTQANKYELLLQSVLPQQVTFKCENKIKI